MGFTVPLVFAQHVFAVSSEAYGAVTVALLVATVLGAVIGIGVLRSAD
jgi:Na+/H+ antiporter NhaA